MEAAVRVGAGERAGLIPLLLLLVLLALAEEVGGRRGGGGAVLEVRVGVGAAGGGRATSSSLLLVLAFAARPFRLPLPLPWPPAPLLVEPPPLSMPVCALCGVGMGWVRWGGVMRGLAGIEFRVKEMRPAFLGLHLPSLPRHLPLMSTRSV